MASTKVYDEVLKANTGYVAGFGDKGKLALPPAAPSPFSPAWTRGSIRRNTLASRKATRMSSAMPAGAPATMRSARW